jgi:hypothetical protein
MTPKSYKKIEENRMKNFCWYIFKKSGSLAALLAYKELEAKEREKSETRGKHHKNDDLL